MPLGYSVTVSKFAISQVYDIAELYDISAKFMTKFNLKKLDFKNLICWRHAHLCFEFCSVLHNYFKLAMSNCSSLILYGLSL